MAAHVFRALSLFSLVLAVGCSKTASQAVEKPRAVEEKSTPQAPVTEDDFKILDVVLVDLLDYEEFNTFSRRKDAATEIILDTMTEGDSFYIGQGQLDGEAYSDKEPAISVELGDDLRRRNPKELISVAGYKSPSPKVLVQKLAVPVPLDDFYGEKAKARHFVSAWLPGYSKDGNTAVFRASFGPTPHGATLTYKLAKKEGKWAVVWRYVAHYV